jgi:hypothetical protein
MKPCNKNIVEVFALVRRLLFIADKGDMQRDDDGCGVLYGIVRDSAYKIGAQAEQEKKRHLAAGKWDGDASETEQHTSGTSAG